MSAKHYKKLRIFVASPGDVTAERERVHAVTAELNRKGNVADQLGLILEVLDWRDVSPKMGRPEQVTLDELKVEQWDIFVGILWLRFGMPPGVSDPQTGKPYDSGTEEEFSLAYQSWLKNGRPHILFYRCTRSPLNVKQINPEQLERVSAFFERFNPGASNEGLYQEFQTTEDFERRVRSDLTKLLFEYGKQVLKKEPPRARPHSPIWLSFPRQHRRAPAGRVRLPALLGSLARNGDETFAGSERA